MTRERYRRAVPIFTIGHGTLPADAFFTLLGAAAVQRLVDVRSYPGSRHNPQFGREALESSSELEGIRYEWLRDLGGRRRPRPDSRHDALRNDAFRGYADHMESDAFSVAVDHLVAESVGEQTAVMCSETLWWRCHRRLLADHLVLVTGIEVVHLSHDGRRAPHVPTDAARLEGDHVVYDVGTTRAFDLTSG